MATDRAPDIYVPLLMTKGHGYRLWLPDPFSTLPPAYLRCGTQVGDLGYLTDDGGFAYLFNVCKDASDPINLNRVPPDFVPVMGIPVSGIQGRLEMHDKNSVITTAAVEQKSIGFAVSAEAPNVPVVLGAGCGFEFTSSSSRTAILVLPDGGERYDSEHPLLLQEYAISNAHSWYKYFNGPGQGRQIRNGMLYLVTGCDKCHSWGNACYLHPTKSSSASLKFVATGVATLTGTACYRWEVQAGVHKRSHHRDITPGATANQTIFLRGYSISVREDSSLRVKLRITNLVKTSNKNKPQRIGSLVPYSAKQIATGRPGTAWQDHDTMRTTGRSLLASEADGSSSDELPAHSTDEVPESSEDESETGKLIIDIPYGHATMQAETLIRQLPGRGKIVNPSALVNKYILDTYRDATIALTHDDFEWTGMTQNPLDVVELASYALDNLVSINESLTTPNAWVTKRRDADIGTFARQNEINSVSNSWDYSRHWNPTSPSTRSYTPQWSVLAEVDDHMVHNESQPPIWTQNAQRRRMVAIRQRGSDLSAESVDLSGTGSSSSLSDTPNAILLVSALQAEVKTTCRRAFIDNCLFRIQYVATKCDEGAQSLVRAGAVPMLVHLLEIRATEPDGLEVVLTTLGLVAHDIISANIIYRTNTTRTLIEIVKSSTSDPVITLALWCLSRICRNADVAAGLIKQNLVSVVLEKTLRSKLASARMSAWCIGILIHNDAIADELSDLGVIPEIAAYLRQASTTSAVTSDDICAGLYAVARIARTIKLSKALYKQGCVSLVSFHLTSSNDPSVLMWAAYAAGCMIQPNSADMIKVLVDADVARGLCRLPSVLPPEVVEPLGSFAFAIQRFICAEWGGGTRKALVDAGVVNALLIALRTVADEPYPQIHMQTALAMSFLGDVGGSAIRKEIVNAGGTTILKRVAENGSADVSKACSMAVTSITSNRPTRNPAFTKTATTHNWSVGCPDYHTACPVSLATQSPRPSG